MSGKALLQQISTTKLFSHWMGCIILRAVCRKNKACIVSFSYQIFKSSKFDHRKNKAFLHGVILFYLCLFVIEVSVDLIHLESVFFFLEPFALDIIVQKFTTGPTTFSGSSRFLPLWGRMSEDSWNKVDCGQYQSPTFFVS